MPVKPGRRVSLSVFMNGDEQLVPTGATASIEEVVAMLWRCLGIHVICDAAKFPGQIGYGKSTEILESGPAGTIVRIVMGAAFLQVFDGDDRLDLDFGGWAFIPPGLRFQLTGTLVSPLSGFKYAIVDASAVIPR